ncbi:MAG: phosphoribosylaminoimidazolesuccinocarboxamide synthase [Dehalococcoidia bacterium]
MLGGLSRASLLLWRTRNGSESPDRLSPPIFTPTTKAETGHDQPLTRQQLEEILATRILQGSCQVCRKYR